MNLTKKHGFGLCTRTLFAHTVCSSSVRFAFAAAITHMYTHYRTQGAWSTRAFIRADGVRSRRLFRDYEKASSKYGNRSIDQIEVPIQSNTNPRPHHQRQLRQGPHSQKLREACERAQRPMPATSALPAAAAAAAAAAALAPEPALALEDVVRDAHMQSLFLQHLSAHDKKGFARLLFLYAYVYHVPARTRAAASKSNSLYMPSLR